MGGGSDLIGQSELLSTPGIELYSVPLKAQGELWNVNSTEIGVLYQQSGCQQDIPRMCILKLFPKHEQNIYIKIKGWVY